MRKLIWQLLLIGSTAFWIDSALALDEAEANPPATSDPIFDDVYVRLYLQRVQRAKVQTEMQRERLKLKRLQRDRRETLYKKNAVSAQELDQARGAVEAAALAVVEYEALTSAQEAMLDIAVDRVSLGLGMPICVELR